MIGGASPATVEWTIMGSDHALLYVAEFQHRINNEYAKAISFVSRLLMLSSAPEAKTALLEVIDHLHASAKIHHTLRPPLPGELVDFTAHMGELCEAFASTGLKQQGINLYVTISGSAVIDAARSWRASLIIEELMTNSVRHACSAGGGHIRVAIGTDGGNVACEISDDGMASAAIVRPGVGTHLVDALTDELQGHISRSYTKSGAVVRLCFPIKPEQH